MLRKRKRSNQPEGDELRKPKKSCLFKPKNPMSKAELAKQATQQRRQLASRIPVTSLQGLVDRAEAEDVFRELMQMPCKPSKREPDKIRYWHATFGNFRLGKSVRPGANATVDRLVGQALKRLGFSDQVRTNREDTRSMDEQGMLCIFLSPLSPFFAVHVHVVCVSTDVCFFSGIWNNARSLQGPSAVLFPKLLQIGQELLPTPSARCHLSNLDFLESSSRRGTSCATQLPEQVIRNVMLPFAPPEFRYVNRRLGEASKQRMWEACPAEYRPDLDAPTNRWVCYENPFSHGRIGPYGTPCCPPETLETPEGIVLLLKEFLIDPIRVGAMISFTVSSHSRSFREPIFRLQIEPSKRYWIYEITDDGYFTFGVNREGNIVLIGRYAMDGLVPFLLHLILEQRLVEVAVMGPHYANTFMYRFSPEQGHMELAVRKPGFGQSEQGEWAQYAIVN